ncbi:MAG: type II secretion system protein GspG [Myxococcota bacterium]
MNRAVVIVFAVLGLVITAGIGCLVAFFVGGAAFYGASVDATMEEAQIQDTRARLARVESAIQMYQLQHNKVPKKLKDLSKGDKKVLPSDSSLEDAWGNIFVYSRKDDTTYTLSSRGPDGQKGTVDDITLKP